ncbi:MAG: hypothetical protein ACE5JR_13315 [Gemmatimonadota bacterium]
MRITLPAGRRPSAALRGVEELGVASFAPAEDQPFEDNAAEGRRSEGGGHLMVVTFDGGAAGRSEDFRPDLPLVFRW